MSLGTSRRSATPRKACGWALAVGLVVGWGSAPRASPFPRVAAADPSELPCFNLTACGTYYAWLAANLAAESYMPADHLNVTELLHWPTPLLGNREFHLSESINNIDSYQKCRYRRDSAPKPQALEYCVYTLTASMHASSPLLTATTCESTVKFGGCMVEQKFPLLGVLAFMTDDGVNSYLTRCNATNRTLWQHLVIPRVRSLINSTLATPGGKSVFGMAMSRSCGDHSAPVAAPGPVIMITITAVLVTLAIASELFEYFAHLAARPGAGGRADDDARGNGAEAKLLINAAADKPPGDLPAIRAASGPPSGGFASRYNCRTPLGCFNARANLGELFSGSGARSLGGLDGLKGFSMLWIILAHSTMFTGFVGLTNPAAPKNFLLDPANYFTFSATYAVDTFFLLSGELTAYVTAGRLRKLRRGPGVGLFGSLVALRWLRLTPLYAYVLFLDTYLAPTLATGPLWYRMLEDVSYCRTWWWSNLLYINNFVPGQFWENCMPSSWYLANDLQFHVVGMAIMFLYLRCPRAAVALTAALTVATVVAGYVLAEERNLGQDLTGYMNGYYDKPYIRIPPFTVGLLLGLAVRDGGVKRLRMSTAAAFCAMSVCVGALVFLFYIQVTRWDPSGYDQPTVAMKDTWSAANWAGYTAFGRVLFMAALAGISVLNASGNGGVVHGFLTLPFWEPVGKLTFGAYLLHPAVLRVYFYQFTQLYEFSHISQTMVFAGAATLAYALSTATYVLIERPFDLMVKGFTQRRRKK